MLRPAAYRGQTQPADQRQFQSVSLRGPFHKTDQVAVTLFKLSGNRAFHVLKFSYLVIFLADQFVKFSLNRRRTVSIVNARSLNALDY